VSGSEDNRAPGPAGEKAALRRRIAAARAAAEPEQRAAAGRLIRDHVLEMPQVAAAGTVAAYYSAGTEPDTRQLVFARWKRGSYVVLPVLLPDGDLDWAAYAGDQDLVPARFGLLEPVSSRLGSDAVATADAVLLPGLAVSLRGDRLGRGGGSYDRALGRVPVGTFTCVLLHDDEVGVDVPVEPHDRPVTAAASPAGITRFAPTF
jgi:5-formyltetrahydrofolate cyclo-ligase